MAKSPLLHDVDQTLIEELDDPAAIEGLGIIDGPDHASIQVPDDKASTEKPGLDANIQQPDDQVATEEREELVRFHRPLHDAASSGNWDNAERFLVENPKADITQVKLNGMTILHLAAEMGHAVFIKKLVQSGLFPKAAMKLKDNTGWTALHYAATLGSLDIVKLLVPEDNSLTQVLDNSNATPLYRAAAYAANKTVIWYLAKTTTNDDPPAGYGSRGGPFSADRGTFLMDALATVGHYNICLYLLNRHPQIVNDLLNVQDPNRRDLLGCLAVSPDQFPSGCRLSFWERFIYHFIPTETPVSVTSDLESHQLQQFSTVRSKLVTVIHWIFGAASKVLVYVPTLKHIRDLKYKHKCIMELLEVTCKTMSSWNSNATTTYFNTRKAHYKAAKLGVIEIIRAFIKHIPEFMDINSNEVGIIFWAIENRREHVFNLMMERGVTVKLLPEFSNEQKRETFLHVAAKLAPYTRLTSVSSPALQMQRELQWFEGVEKFVRPIMKAYVNVEGQTARELFTTEHKELAQDAERWLKDTSNSCLVVATLIITVIFSVAFTIPGGNIDRTGIPLFLHRNDFMLFIVSDAVGMFSSATSILMFLSILTARYAEDDFLRPLPKWLILGLVSLLIALASMMVAFGVALYMILSPKFRWITLPIVGLTSVPVGLFILLQLPLFILLKLMC